MRKDPHTSLMNGVQRRRREAMANQDCIPLEKAKVGVHYQLWNLTANQPEPNMVEWGVSDELRYVNFAIRKLVPTTDGRFRVTIATVKGDFTFEMHGSLPLRKVV